MAGGELALNAPAKEEAERLLIEAAQRDPSRFAELYEDNFERVYAFIARRVRDRDEAEDLTSEVFHQALANLARFEWRGVPFAAWLFRISRHARATWRGAGLRFHADWIFVNGVNVKRWGVVKPMSVSDHWPIWAEIESSEFRL